LNQEKELKKPAETWPKELDAMTATLKNVGSTDLLVVSVELKD